MRDLRKACGQSARRLLRARTFALAVVVTFAVGIAGVATVFALVDAVLLRPLPYRRADELVDLSHTLQVSGLLHVDQSDATYLGYRRHNHVFTDIGAYRATAVNALLQSGPGPGPGAANAAAPLRLTAALATGSLFNVLGVVARGGRTLLDADGAPGAPPVVVIGERLWIRRFDRDPAIVGKRLMVDGVPREIVGVLPGTFRFPSPETELWIPLMLDPGHVASAAFDYRAIARLRNGVSPAAAAIDLQRVLPSVPDEFPGRLTAASIPAVHMQAVVRPLRDVVVGDAGHALWIVLGAVGVLLLVACANVANLFVARAQGRRRELAIRRALGARPGALYVDFLSEAALLVAAGAGLGLTLAAVALRLLPSLPASATIPRLDEVRLDGAVIAVVAGTTGLIAMLVGTFAVVRTGRMALSGLLSAGDRASTSGPTRLRGRRTLVVTQIALALVLLIAAGLLTRSFARLRRVDPGFVASHAVILRMTLPEVSYPAASDAARLIVRSLVTLELLPGVQSAGVSTSVPLSEQGRQDSAVFIEDHPVTGKTMAGGIPDLHPIVFVTPGYFRAVGIPLVAGRLLPPPDPAGSPSDAPPEVMVSAAFARHYWSGASAIGKRVRMNPADPWSTIVGVVGDVRDAALGDPPSEIVYSALVTRSAAGAPWTPHTVAFIVRTSGDPGSLIVPAERALAALDPSLPLYGVMPLDALLAGATARMSFTLALLAVAAVIAVLIGAIGLYGVMAYFVSLQTREIGVRLALGAAPRTVRRMVVRRAMADAATGIVLGLLGATAAARLIASLLFEMSPVDPLTFAAAATVLLLTALAASWLPARGAAALDPATALRGD